MLLFVLLLFLFLSSAAFCSLELYTSHTKLPYDRWIYIIFFFFSLYFCYRNTVLFCRLSSHRHIKIDVQIYTHNCHCILCTHRDIQYDSNLKCDVTELGFTRCNSLKNHIMKCGTSDKM